MTADNDLSIVVVSPRNPYYTKTNIAFALDTVLRESASLLVFIPDVPDIHNYLAYGYGEEKAEHAAHTHGAAFRDTLHEICADRRYSCADSGHADARVRIIDWQAEVENAACYRAARAEVERLYLTCAAFRDDARQAASSSINSKIRHTSKLKKYLAKTGMEAAIDKAVNYPISELGFFGAAPEMFAVKPTARTHINCIYHMEWPALENFIAGAYGNGHRADLTFRMVNNKLVA